MSQTSNCVQCILRPINKLGFILFSSTVIHCRHINSEVETYIEPNFSSKWFLFFLTWLIFTVGESINKLSVAEHFRDVFYDFVSLFQMIPSICLMWIFRRNYNTHSIQLTILMRLVENRKYFGIEYFLSERFTSRAKSKFRYITYYFLSHITFFAIYNTYRELSIENIIYQLGRQVGLTFLAYFLLYGLYLVRIYEEIFDSLTKTIECNLRYVDEYEQRDVFTKLNKLLMLYLKLKNNYFACLPSVMTVFGSYIFFASAIVIQAVLFIFLINFEKYYNGNILLFYDYIILNIVLFHIDAYFMAQAFSSVESKTHDVMIFLKKYPFSKLTKIQASQIELLTQVFTQESLIIKVGNLEFGVPVLASVADNALAYFFVVTQFIQMFK